ncbi:MAG: T9SS type A sorting domain-containing protein [Bacteroidota bacterium]
MVARMGGKGFLYTTIVIALSATCVFSQNQRDLVKGNLIQFNDNGAWCWYQDERAVIDFATNKMVLGSVASGSGVGGSARNGVIDAVIFDLQSGTSQRYPLAQFSCDDHNAPGILVRPDGKYIAMYAQHYDQYNSRYRIFSGSTWTPEQRFDWTTIPGGTDYTIAYSNLYYLSKEGRMYNFARANHRCPNLLYSMNMGDSWLYGGILATNTSNTYNKGYYKYWGNGVDRIDFIFTEQHPRDTTTSIYHGYIENGKSYRSDGVVADDNILDTLSIPSFGNFTKVFGDNTMLAGYLMRRCWNTDVVRYADGTIVTIVTARTSQYNGSDASINPEHAYIYCRYNGSTWTSTYLGKAGYKMYSSEADYVGNAAVHPNDPNTIYISTSFDPRDSTVNLGVREIFKGVTSDEGATWTWTPITQNSVRNNFRPIVPRWDNNKTALLWWRGTYTSAQLFDAAVVGIIDSNSETIRPKSYVDATPANTTLATGDSLVATGPDPNQGAADNRWHIRTGYGNGGSVLTSAEPTGSGENAPALKTRVTVPQAGTYDVWVNFWANPSTGNDWRIKAGLSPSSMQLFRQMACKEVELGDHDRTLVLSGSGSTFLYQAYLGRVQVSGGDTFDVFVDDSAVQVGTPNTLKGDIDRTWYDGVSYANLSSAPARVPVISISASAINFGTVAQGMGKRDSVDISNFGTDTLKVTSISSTDSFFRFAPATFNIAPSANVYLVVTFAPGDTSNAAGFIILTHNAIGSPDSIALSGKGILTDVTNIRQKIPTAYALSQNYPNPFNPATTVSYSLPQNTYVVLKVYNLLGQEMATLVDKEMPAGTHSVVWNAQDAPSGVYLYKITAGNYTKMSKMVLMK